jgi:hypothetical protein
VPFSQDERTILERGDLLPMAKARGITQDLVRELEPHGMTVWCLSSILTNGVSLLQTIDYT